MKLAGEHRFAAPRERVWQALLDPEVLAGTLPGFQRLERVGDNEYAAWKTSQPAFEPFNHVDIQMIGRLIQNEYLRLFK